MPGNLGLIENEPADWADTCLRVAPSTDAPWTYQGLIYPQVLVYENLVKDDGSHGLIGAVTTFAGQAINDALLLPGEFPVEAVYAWYLEYYEGQVFNGGHGQWASNIRWDRTAALSTLFGLARIGAHDCRNNLLRFIRRVNDMKPKRFQKMIGDAGFNEPDPIEEAADDFFLGQDDATLPSTFLAPWLKSKLSIQSLSKDELEQEIASARQANPLAADRQADLDRRRSNIFRPPSVQNILEQLCLKSGCRLEDFERDWYAGLISKKGAFAWSVTTSKGRYYAIATAPGVRGHPPFSPRRIVLVQGAEFGAKQADIKILGKMSLSKDDFAKIDHSDIPDIEPEQYYRRPFDPI